MGESEVEPKSGESPIAAAHLWDHEQAKGNIQMLAGRAGNRLGEVIWGGALPALS